MADIVAVRAIVDANWAACGSAMDARSILFAPIAWSKVIKVTIWYACRFIWKIVKTNWLNGRRQWKKDFEKIDAVEKDINVALKRVKQNDDALQLVIRDGHFGDVHNELVTLLDANKTADFMTSGRFSDYWKSMSTQLRALTVKRKQLKRNKKLVLNALRNISDAVKNATDLISAILSQVDEPIESGEEDDEDSSDESAPDNGGNHFQDTPSETEYYGFETGIEVQSTPETPNVVEIPIAQRASRAPRHRFPTIRRI